MSAPCCDNCIYSVVDPELWRRLMWKGEPILPRCANHPTFPGRLCEVPGVACRNYRRRPTLPQGDAIRLLALGDGSYAYVDAADYEWLSQWTWYTYDGGYPARFEGRRKVFMHREIMQPPPGMVVDHRDANRANNCRFNLRVCTREENMRNNRKQSRSSSRYKGVGYMKQRGKFYGRIWCEGDNCHLGYFDDEAEAARAYDRAAVERFGEFARLNFPEEWPRERRARVHAEWEEGQKREGKEAPRGPT